MVSFITIFIVSWVTLWISLKIGEFRRKVSLLTTTCIASGVKVANLAWKCPLTAKYDASAPKRKAVRIDTAQIFQLFIAQNELYPFLNLRNGRNNNDNQTDGYHPLFHPKDITERTHCSDYPKERKEKVKNFLDCVTHSNEKLHLVADYRHCQDAQRTCLCLSCAPHNQVLPWLSCILSHWHCNGCPPPCHECGRSFRSCPLTCPKRMNDRRSSALTECLPSHALHPIGKEMLRPYPSRNKTEHISWTHSRKNTYSLPRISSAIALHSTT